MSFKRSLKKICKTNSTHIREDGEKIEKTQKQLNELREDFNNLQNKTKETIKRRGT
jgi:uncharacterized coiled-coil protein SlyX